MQTGATGPEKLMGVGVATNPHYPVSGSPMPGLNMAPSIRLWVFAKAEALANTR
jgi:hypothetical protein